jgi:hypothetical protein
MGVEPVLVIVRVKFPVVLGVIVLGEIEALHELKVASTGRENTRDIDKEIIRNPNGDNHSRAALMDSLYNLRKAADIIA